MAKTKIPTPGKPVRGSESGKPVMALIDLMGRRWILRILWELRGEPLTFRALQEACGGVSPSVLNGRLGDLREAALIEATGDGYGLTAMGRELGKEFEALTHWAEKWAKVLK
ncbi:MAG: helix-turn-helix domain-containing protein [Parvibaculum sp.]|nr:helix-turn-helix domain-containing protein [Parvibaculum sp.]|tara:strand:- start:202 stop:537 length:336 start_codon:yes stop_codon:yes gene_type:complete